MLDGDWLKVESEFNFRPRFVKVLNGKSVIDWTCLPWHIMEILQCGGKIKRTLYTQQGGIYDPNEKPKRKYNYPKKPKLLDYYSRIIRQTFNEREPIRVRLYDAQKGLCHYCNTFIESGNRYWTIDHKLPISRGGTHEDSNLVGCCEDCNSNKSWMTDEEFLKSDFLIEKIKRIGLK